MTLSEKVFVRTGFEHLYMPLGPSRGENLFLDCLYSWITNFKALSVVTTVTGNQSNKIRIIYDVIAIKSPQKNDLSTKELRDRA